MKKYKVNKEVFKFKYLPEYASYLLQHKLEEFVTVGIRFCREIDLPMLKPLAKFSEEELTALSMDSNRIMLKALTEGTISDFIEENIQKWVSNKLEVLDKSEIIAEDLILAYFVRRKLFSHFLYGYTPNAVVQQLIIAEVDVYTTQEELVSLKAYLDLHKINVKS